MISVIPITEGRRLFEEYSGPKSAFVIEGGHHDDLWQMGGREIVFDALDKMTSPVTEADSEKAESPRP